jgi:single-strand DNA-binding protein
MNINRVTLLGYVSQDVKSTKTSADKQVSSFVVATNYLKSVEFHPCVAWGKLADVATSYLKKGDRVYVEGRLATRNWIGKDKLKKYKTEIVANHLIMLGHGNGAAHDGPDEMVDGESRDVPPS